MDFEDIRIKPVWSKSKEEIWAEKFEPLFAQAAGANQDFRIASQACDDRFVPLNVLKSIPIWGYVAGLMLPILLFSYFYTVTETTMRGEQAVVQLPDRSTVTLNAESKLSYKPVVWLISRKGAMSPSRLISRKVSLEGEAYFEVTPGNRFSVQTGDNRVNVLGTSFNVQARPGMYRVTCLSGQVEVQAGKETAVLSQHMEATLRDRKLNVSSDVTTAVATGWMQGMFVFAGTPLGEVIAELERRYNITVIPDYDTNLLYSGNFSKTENPEEILEAIGKAFGITFSIHNFESSQ